MKTIRISGRQLVTVTSAVICMAISNLSAAQEPPSLKDFATQDGAYFTTVDGKSVDPYFVNKGFIIALQADAPLQKEFGQWLQWLLPRQRADGGFDRYCQRGDAAWHSCQKADADDSMAATTMQMLTLGLQKKWVPAAQQATARKAIKNARKLLASLLNPSTQLYKVFGDTELYYLMDNAEVYEGLRAVGSNTSANALATAIRKQFWDGQKWKPALPEYAKAQFYPHTLASAYLWSTSILPANEANSAVAQWLAQYGPTWLNRSGDQYAWGLVAWQLRQAAPIQAACWRASMRPFNSAVGWTVLDAMIDQSLAQRGIGMQCPLLPMPATPAPAKP